MEIVILSNKPFHYQIKQKVTYRTEVNIRRAYIIESLVSEELRCIFSKHPVSVAFKHQNTLRQKLVHPKDRVPDTNRVT